MASLFTTPQQKPATLLSGGSGSLASLYKPPGGDAGINVVKDYTWTLSQYAKDNAPVVELTEFEVNETTIKRQAMFYGSGAVKSAVDTGKAIANKAMSLITSNTDYQLSQNTDPLDVYKELYPKDKPTGFKYYMPYFSDINFEVNTPMWASLDTLEQAKSAASGISSALLGEKAGERVGKALDMAGAVGTAALAASYPKVGITDRPRLWNSHEPRSIEIKFPLFNTLDPNDWTRNRELCELLVNQNLYNKRDFITSIPPVFYEVKVYGQHFSWASCVTRLTIYNRGNMRLLNGVNIPDVYEVNITLTDMVMPSKNMFQSITKSVVTTETAAKQQTQPKDAVPQTGQTSGLTTTPANGFNNGIPLANTK
jgi:hypothetical protein